MEYRVELDVFNGPLDLLLYLIKRDELDIYDIPITSITETYMQYLNMLRDVTREHGLDINVAGDFLVMAATLMEIKSAMLLPKPPPELQSAEPSAAAELADPRYELVQKLLEYKKFKDNAMALDFQQKTFESRFPRVPAKLDESNEPPPLDMDEVQIWDLLNAFSTLMKEVGVRKPKYHEVLYDDTPIDLHAADIEDRLTREHKLHFRALILGRKSKSEMIGVFLALLELVREKKILVQASDIEGEIDILPAPEEHRRTYPHASLHLASEQEPTETTTGTETSAENP